MQAIQWVINACVWLSSLFYSVYLEVLASWYIPNIIGLLFLYVSDRFMDLAAFFTSFLAWVINADNWLARILRAEDIWALLSLPIQWAQIAYNWVVNAWNIVTGWIDDWWDWTTTTVQGWIDIATEGLASLRVAWDNFWNYTLPNLLDYFKLENWWSTKLFGFDTLIDSTLKRWFPWYETLVNIIDEIFAFFADPVEYAYNKMDEFFERFW